MSDPVRTMHARDAVSGKLLYYHRRRALFADAGEKP